MPFSSTLPVSSWRRTAPVLLLLATPLTPALAQGTMAQRMACTGDAFRFCGQHIPDVPAVTGCMKENFRSLSPGCQAQFPGATKRRGTL